MTAMIAVNDNPEWSDARIARLVGKSPSTLSRSNLYQEAANIARGSEAAGRIARPPSVPRRSDADADSHQNDVDRRDVTE